MLLTSLRSLIAPPDPLLIGEIIFQNSDGTMSIRLTDGSVIAARGTLYEVGSKVYVQSGQIQGEAPNLPVDYVEG